MSSSSRASASSSSILLGAPSFPRRGARVDPCVVRFSITLYTARTLHASRVAISFGSHFNSRKRTIFMRVQLDKPQLEYTGAAGGRQRGGGRVDTPLARYIGWTRQQGQNSWRRAYCNTRYKPHDCLSGYRTYKVIGSQAVRPRWAKFTGGLGFYKDFGGAKDATKTPRNCTDFCI